MVRMPETGPAISLTRAPRETTEALEGGHEMGRFRRLCLGETFLAGLFSEDPPRSYQALQQAIRPSRSERTAGDIQPLCCHVTRYENEACREAYSGAPWPGG
ncbi:protein of unknown function [Nitrospira defluvii]|uniref:Uncharacterized protein n=1 Tax=Nitrospira defluvii TaxID=330214 RepID=D8P7Y7_9BACT|nr:protein of unknown function [Nitrospira defluvii]